MKGDLPFYVTLEIHVSPRPFVPQWAACRLYRFAMQLSESGGIDLLKLDCEGAEWDIFADADAFRRVRLIRMEFHLTEGRTLSEFESRVKDLGFHIDRLVPNRDYGIAWISNRFLSRQEPWEAKCQTGR